MRKPLIVYYSRKGENYWNGQIKNLAKGNTEIVAEMIAGLTGGDLFEVQTVQDYAADYYACTDQAKAELQQNARPALKRLPEHLEQYDTIFVGYPNWWGTMPMALFTLLEDFGYLPRVAFNLDHCFQKANSCGKQALTMCMGLGCNAVGVTGCRIIDSPRERLIAVLTNSLMPCNGRFSTLISLIAMFVVVGQVAGSSLLRALVLTGLIVLSVLATFLSSWLLSKTALKGKTSSFALELPPYRRPQIGKVIVRSVLDRTLFVLGRAAAVAAPAGLVIWLLANCSAGGQTLLGLICSALDPFAQLFGIDGVILTALILSFPANEIFLPLILMGYLQSATLAEVSLTELHSLLLSQEWTVWTALAVMVLCLFHWPCSTTLLTIRKETGSLRWCTLSALLPTAIGFLLCALLQLVRLLVAG